MKTLLEFKKLSMSTAKLRAVERGKIECARKHFEAISNGDIKYGVVDSYESLIYEVTGVTNN